MTIELASDVEEFLNEQVRLGACADRSALVNDVLRAMREQLHRSFNLSPELEAWLLESAVQTPSPLAPSDFAGIRERVAARLGGSSA